MRIKDLLRISIEQLLAGLQPRRGFGGEHATVKIELFDLSSQPCNCAPHRAESGQIVEIDFEGGGDLFQRLDGAFALSVLDLREVADPDRGARGELTQRAAAV